MKAYFQKPIDEEFNDSYGRSGMQPSVGSVQHFRRVEADRSSTQRTTGTSTTKLGSGVKTMRKEAQNTSRGTNRAKVVSKNLDNVETPPMKKVLRFTKNLPIPAGKVAGYGGDALVKIWERRKVTRANATILSIGLSIIWPIQVILATMSLAFLGLAYTAKVIDATIEANSKAVLGETITNLLGTAYDYTIGAGARGIDWIFTEIFGFSLEALGDPTNWFTVTWYLVVLLGWATLLMTVCIYIFTMTNPFFGKGAAWKMSGFLVAVFGYLIPGLNILPWFAVYTACVWKNPE